MDDFVMLKACGKYSYHLHLNGHVVFEVKWRFNPACATRQKCLQLRK
jgi:hypothetical protein